MSGTVRAARFCAVISAFFFSLVLAGVPAGAAEEMEVDVVGGNSSNSLMFWLKYTNEPGGIDEAITLNTDANAYPSLNSFTFLGDTCGTPRTDVVAASTNASQLVIYTGGKGAGTPICGAADQPACPARPVGLSTSAEQVVAVATSGAAGSTPGVFTFTPDEAECGKLNLAGGNLSVDGTRIRAIADTEFARGDAVGLDDGDLLVLVSNPAMLVRVSPESIGSGPVVGEEFAGSLKVFEGYRRATPTGLAIVPGEDRSVLVTLSTGVIVNFYQGDNGWTAATLPTDNLLPNPRGIAAGAREGTPYIVVSEQNRGRYIRAELEGAGATLALLKPFREIVSPVGAPEGVAVNNEDVFLLTCFQPVTVEQKTTGCQLDGSLELHFSRGFEPDWPPRGGRVGTELILIPDPESNTLRDVNNGFLPLDQVTDIELPDALAGKGFQIPPFCRGFESANYAEPQLILVNVDINFPVKPVNFVVVTELAQELLGLDDDCKGSASRIYYHPSVEDPAVGETFTFFDTTFSCQNPSRSIVETFSPVVLCSDSLHLERLGSSLLDQSLRNTFNDQLRPRIQALKDYVAELQAAGVDPAITSFLQSLLVAFTNPDMRSITEEGLRAYYLDTARKADDGALKIFAQKQLGTFTDPAVPSDLYARMLRGFLSLAFYASETGALVEYRPPYELCQPYSYPALVNGQVTSVTADFELPDVNCAARRP